MKQIKTKSGDIFCMEVPENAYDFSYDDFRNEISANLQKPFYEVDWFSEKLPNGNYQIIGKLSELTDKDCEEFTLQWGEDMSRDIIKSIVLGYSDIIKIDEDKGLGYKDYMDNMINNYTLTPKESFISLLQSEGIDTSKEQLILQLL